MDNERLVRTVRGATEEVFSLMLGLPVECGEPYQEQAEDQSFDGVVALVGLAGSWVGAGRLSCSAAFACRVSGALLAAEYAAIDEDVLDAMAEVTNMIIGNVKSQLEEDYGTMGLSIPTVIFGRNYRARSTGAGTWTVVPFVSGSERMYVKLCLVRGVETLPHRADTMVHHPL